MEQSVMEANSSKLCEAILSVPLPMLDAVAFYEAMDKTYWRGGTDTYLKVVLTDGTEWEVGTAKPREVHAREGSPLAERGVYYEWRLELAYGEHTPHVEWAERQGREVRNNVTEYMEVYDKDIAHASVEAY